jgi:hypothetical protein
MTAITVKAIFKRELKITIFSLILEMKRDKPCSYNEGPCKCNVCTVLQSHKQR